MVIISTQGVFVRHLAYNYAAIVAAHPELDAGIQAFARANGDSLVAHDVRRVAGDEDQYGEQWRGPFTAPSGGPAPAQGSAVDLMNAAFWILGSGAQRATAPGF